LNGKSDRLPEWQGSRSTAEQAEQLSREKGHDPENALPAGNKRNINHSIDGEHDHYG
jgi:hypothetical protein